MTEAAVPGVETWSWIHGLPLVFIDGCWTTYESFCCTSKHPDLQFRVIRPDQTFLPMLAASTAGSRSEVAGGRR